MTFNDIQQEVDVYKRQVVSRAGVVIVLAGCRFSLERIRGCANLP